eukprot:Mrub_01134.p1 GENE.Mrub_01134~~Mrub_01134.p1  ORF type:complete len:663 (+),score=138.18 Mrub_01134:340-2328(+)
MTWFNTPLKKEKENENSDDQVQSDIEDKDKADDVNTLLKELYGESIDFDQDKVKWIIQNIKKTYNVKDISQVKKLKHTPFEEDDFPLRTPYAGYEELKLFETRCMNLANKYNHLSCYVVACGLTYGNGEDLLFEYFKQAWLQDPAELPIMNDGLNHIPTVHVIDVARLVYKILVQRPTRQYIIAVDKTNYCPNTAKDNSRAYNIVKSISVNIGSGKVKMVPAETMLNNPRYQQLLINLFFKPSELMIQDITETSLNENQPDETKYFDWFSEYGINSNIEKIRQDFNLNRGLKSIKFLVSGQIASGKSMLSVKLAEQYNIPLISIENVINEWMAEEYEAKATDPESDPYVDQREIVGKYKEELDIYNQGQQDKKKKDKKGAAEKPKLPDEILMIAYKWKLKQNACLNKGFILDNFPKTYEQCKELFMDKKKTDSDEDNTIYELNSGIMPNKLCILSGSDADLNARIKKLQAEKYSDPAYVDRRLKLYKQRNEDESGSSTPLSQFFNENSRYYQKFEVFVGETTKEEIDINVLVDSVKKMEDEIVNFNNVEEKRDGIVGDQDDQAEKVPEIKQKEFKVENEEKVVDAKENKRKTNEDKKSAYRESEINIIESKSVALRTYLTDNVMDKLTEGLIETCRIMPDDPVDFLADFLDREAQKYKSKHN